MSLEQGKSESGKDPKQDATSYSVQRAHDEYVPVAVSVMPESVSPATMNEQNRKYWKNAGGEQS